MFLKTKELTRNKKHNAINKIRTLLLIEVDKHQKFHEKNSITKINQKSFKEKRLEFSDITIDLGNKYYNCDSQSKKQPTSICLNFFESDEEKKKTSSKLKSLRRCYKNKSKNFCDFKFSGPPKKNINDILEKNKIYSDKIISKNISDDKIFVKKNTKIPINLNKFKNSDEENHISEKRLLENSKVNEKKTSYIIDDNNCNILNNNVCKYNKNNCKNNKIFKNNNINNIKSFYQKDIREISQTDDTLLSYDERNTDNPDNHETFKNFKRYNLTYSISPADKLFLSKNNIFNEIKFDNEKNNIIVEDRKANISFKYLNVLAEKLKNQK